MNRMWSKVFVSTALVLLAGCSVINSLSPNCDRSVKTNPPVTYTEGKTENGLYMSSPWAGELLYFPGGMRYEIHHGLGETPHFVEAWLSFDQCGVKNSTVALAAGNQAEVRELDQDKLEIVNGSCSDYWLLIIAGTGAEPPSPPPDMNGDAGVSDGVCVGDGGDGG